MKNPVRLAILAAVLVLATGVQAADPLKYRGKAAAGKMRIEGDSTIHKWYVETLSMSGDLELDPSFPTDPAKTDLKPGPIPAKGTAKIVVRSFKSQWGAPMDAIFLESMDAPKHPRIEYTLKELVFKEAREGAMLCEAKGNLTIRGETKEMVFPVRIDRTDAKTLTVSGTFDMKMSDFKVPPPAPRAFGTIKTMDEVKLIFTWVLTLPAPAAAN